MSVYIKGMEMPKSCFSCPFMYARTLCAANHKIQFDDEGYTELKGRYIGCPLVEIPPHGRLIDADKQKPYMLNEHYRYRRVYDAEEIENAPTIIPADEEDRQ